MAIQMRRGDYADFDPDMMSEGEFAVVQSGDVTTRTGKSVRMCFHPGDVQRLVTQEEMESDVEEAIEESETIHELIKDKTEETLEEHPEWTTTVQDGTITTAKLDDEAVTRDKISDNAVANNLTTASSGTALLDAYQGKVLDDKITQYRAIKVSFGSISSLPQTVNNTNVKAAMECIKAELSNWSAMGGDWTVTTANGSVTVSGTFVSGQTTTLNLILVEPFV